MCEINGWIFVFIIPPGEGGHVFDLSVMSRSLLQSCLFHDPCCASPASREAVPSTGDLFPELSERFAVERSERGDYGAVGEQGCFSRHNKYEISDTLRVRAVLESDWPLLEMAVFLFQTTGETLPYGRE